MCIFVGHFGFLIFYLGGSKFIISDLENSRVLNFTKIKLLLMCCWVGFGIEWLINDGQLFYVSPKSGPRQKTQQHINTHGHSIDSRILHLANKLSNYFWYFDPSFGLAFRLAPEALLAPPSLLYIKRSRRRHRRVQESRCMMDDILQALGGRGGGTKPGICKVPLGGAIRPCLL